MTSSGRNWLTIGATLLVCTTYILGHFAYVGYSDESLRFLLRLGARIGFAIYAVIFVTRPLLQLFKTSMTRSLLRNRRQMGLAVGTIMIVHFCLIMLRFDTNPEFSLGTGAIFGAFVYLLIFLMMVTSFDTPARAVGPKAWRILHKTGLYLAGFAFASTLLPASSQQLFQPAYLGFTVLIAVALAIRLAAFFARRR